MSAHETFRIQRFLVKKQQLNWPIAQWARKKMNPVIPPVMYPNPTCAFSNPIPGGLVPGKTITVSGTVLPSAQSFQINLRRGSDIAFQMSPQFNRDTVVRNSLIKGSWGPEEDILPRAMPFSRGQSFTVRITCEDIGYVVVVNDHRLFYYNHRVTDLPSINVLEVAGDVQVSKVVT